MREIKVGDYVDGYRVAGILKNYVITEPIEEVKMYNSFTPNGGIYKQPLIINISELE